MKSNKRITVLRAGLTAAALLFLAVGAVLGEHLDVMRKAVRICLECIGIG